MFDNIATGTDIEENSRFAGKTLEKDRHFLEKIYTLPELKYCFSKAKPEQNLCARFCAKEAVVKALSDFNITDVYYSDIEILNEENGKPNAKILKYPDIKIKISMSHCKAYSIATVIIFKQ